MTLKLNRILEVAEVHVLNFIQLSAAVNELSWVQRKKLCRKH